MARMNIKNVFSVKNDGEYKIIYILWIRIKLKRKNKIMERYYSEIRRQNLELMYRNVFIDTICESQWLKHKNFSLVGGAANYSFVTQLYIILDIMKPSNILEFGLGQTSKITTQYANYYSKKLTIIEHDKDWIESFRNNLSLNETIKIINKNLVDTEINGIKTDKYENLDDIITNEKFDFIVIDGPFGFDRVYPRTNILELIPNNLSDKFVIILDDAERIGEQNTAKLIFEALNNNDIKYITSYKEGLKSQLIISSMDMGGGVHWY